MTEPDSTSGVPPTWAITGNPSDDEVAAVTAVIHAWARPAREGSQSVTSGWATHWRQVNAAPVDRPHGTT